MTESLPPVFTIGHSDRSTEAFVDLLRASQVQQLVDVRKIPRSRKHPHFAHDALPEALAAHQIAYEHVAELGGRRGRAPATESSPNGLWENRSFRNYADYALTEPFRAGLARLHALARERRCAIMCAEAVWWRCHRRIIADYLLAGGTEVLHILGPGPARAAQLTPGAVIRDDGAVVYPCEQDNR
ncbi:MAG TPA: DUF488 domain-containing protein [Caulobacteraceae bacterium]